MPKTSQVKANNTDPGVAAPSALRGKGDRNKWDVTQQARTEAESHMDKLEPFIQEPIVGEKYTSWPAIYGVDLRNKRREQLLSDISRGTGPFKGVLGDRQVMLDDKTIEWLLDEQARIFMIEKDLLFEDWARMQGLFENPAGLEYLRKIKPDYFARRDQMAEWLSKTQLQLYRIHQRGIQSEEDFNFSLMIQSLPPQQQKLVNTPVHQLMTLDPEEYKDGLYQTGAFRKALLPLFNPLDENDQQVVPFAGLGSRGAKKGWARWMSNPGAGAGIKGQWGSNIFAGFPTLSAYTGDPPGTTNSRRPAFSGANAAGGGFLPGVIRS